MIRKTGFWLALPLACGMVITLTAKAADEAVDPHQGEYVGKFDLGDGIEQGFAFQVIALGEGRYRGVAYFGGLPGDGWDGFTKLEAEGEAKDGELTLEAAEGAAQIDKDGNVVLTSADGAELGRLKKTERKSPTLGAEPPEGAVVLFDGSNADAWEGGKMTDDGLLKPGTVTNQKFNNFTLHLEFRTPFMPSARGQARGNSGVYLQDRYELQILDSFALEGLDNECGGFYSIKAPSLNMCLPPMSWQTYDIDYTAPEYNGDERVTGPKITVRHNGVVIHEELELEKGTPGRLDEGPGPGGIYVQDHGNPVLFRNIWLVEN